MNHAAKRQAQRWRNQCTDDARVALWANETQRQADIKTGKVRVRGVRQLKAKAKQEWAAPVPNIYMRFNGDAFDPRRLTDWYLDLTRYNSMNSGQAYSGISMPLIMRYGGDDDYALSSGNGTTVFGDRAMRITAGTSATTTINVWSSWIDDAMRAHANTYGGVDITRHEVRPPTSEEIATRRRQEIEYTERQRVRLAEGRQAVDRAARLLQSVLTPEQQAEWLRERHFHINVGERRYRIKAGRSGNVELVDKQGAPLVRYCAHPEGYDLPDGDVLVGQVLALQHREAEFLRVANVHWRAAA